MVFPQIAYAANTTVTITQGESENSMQTKIQNAINNSSPGDTVTVTGKNDTAIQPLELNIKSDVTVIWKAEYTKSSGIDANDRVITLTGSGTFDVSDGGFINNTSVTYAIISSGTNIVKVTNGRVYSRGGYAIYATGVGSFVVIKGGVVTSDGDLPTIFTRSIYISNGSWIENTNTGDAINVVGKFSEVVITGSIIGARHGYALYKDDDGPTTFSSCFVFAYGDDLYLVTNGEKNVVALFNGVPLLVNDSIICAWSTPALAPNYNEGSSKDLIATTGATVYWGLKDGQAGIYYANGANMGFFPVTDPWNTIVVNPASAPPTSSTPSGSTPSGPTPPTSSTPPTSTTPPVTDLPKSGDTDGNASSDDSKVPGSDNAGKTADKDRSSTPKDDRPTSDDSSNTWQLVVFGGLAIAAIGSGIAFFIIRRRP
jgi:hypothetical protein